VLTRAADPTDGVWGLVTIVLLIPVMFLAAAQGVKERRARHERRARGARGARQFAPPRPVHAPRSAAPARPEPADATPGAPASEPAPSAAERAAESDARAVSLDGQLPADVPAVEAIFAAYGLTDEMRRDVVLRITAQEVRRRLHDAKAARRWSPDDDAALRHYLTTWGTLPLIETYLNIGQADVPLLRALWALEHQPLTPVESALPLAKGETCYVRSIGRWDEARANGRTTTLLEGDVHITDRQVIVVGWQGRKAVRLADLIAVRHEGDGVWLAGSRARSPFVRFAAGPGAAEMGSVVLARLLGRRAAPAPAAPTYPRLPAS